MKDTSVLNGEKSTLNGVYMEICDELGMDVALAIYHLYKGQQVTFPVHFYNPAVIRKRICEEYDGSNVKELARKYSYTEKSIRRIVKSGEEK